ncbi:hypothetical protein ACVIGV_006661 [Rhizobium leguminosarum]|jgi:hypothetical protein
MAIRDAGRLVALLLATFPHQRACLKYLAYRNFYV